MSMTSPSGGEGYGVVRSSGRRFWFRLLDRLFESPFMFILPIVLLTAVGVAQVARTDLEYESAGVLSIENQTVLADISGDDGPIVLESASDAAARDINDLMGTDAFALKVAERANLAQFIESGALTLDDLRDTTEAASTGPSLVKITTLAPDAQVARDIAQATIDAFRAWKFDREATQARASEQFFVTELNARQQELQVAQDDLSEYLVNNPAPTGRDRPVEEELEINRLNDAVENAREDYDLLSTQVRESRLRVREAEVDLEQRYLLVDTPSVPKSSTSGLKAAIITICLAFIIGAIISGFALLVSSLLDQRVRSEEDIETVPGLEVVAVVRKMNKAAMRREAHASRRQETAA